MALRLGVIAVRAATPVGLGELFPELGDVQPAAGSGWAWAAVSLWTHGHLFGDEAEERLAPRGGLQIWTEDDARWLMAVYRPGREPVRFVQVFHLLELARDPERFTEEEGAETLEQLVRYWEESVPHRYQEAGAWPPGPVPKALRALLARRAEAVSRALREAGVAHDGGEVVGILTGTALEDDEVESGVGNLPRFLEAIGLGGVFPDWRCELEESRREQREAEPEPSVEAPTEAPDPAAAILAALGPREPEPIEDGPLVLGVEEAARLWKIPWCCDNAVQIAFVVRPPADAAPLWPDLDDLAVTETGGEWRVGHPWVSVWARQRLFAELAECLTALPDGTALEMVSAATSETDDPGSAGPTAGNQRFRGVVEDGRWIVTHASPRASVGAIREALALFSEEALGAPFLARDPAEAAAIVARALRSGHFPGDEDRPRSEGRRVVVKDDHRPYLAMIILRERLRDGPWDLRGGEAADEASAVPRGSDLVFQGRRTGFRSADIRALSRVELADPMAALFPGRQGDEPPSLPEAVAAVDRGMARAGLAPLGDMVCEAFSDAVIRGYGKKQGSLYGVLMASTIGAFVYELLTAFSDGTTLTTSVNAGRDAPERRSFHVHLPGASVELLLKRHAQGVFHLLAEDRRPKPHLPDLAGLAAEMDEFLARVGA
jgi:hypothetical protein